MSPDQYCEQKVQKSGSNLTAAFRILPEARRKAITALYAFCREVDDIADECSEVSLAAVKLAWWKTELDALYQRLLYSRELICFGQSQMNIA